MEIYFQLVNDAEGLKKAVAELEKEPFLGFDVETTELEPYRGELRLVQLSNGRNTKVVDLRAFGGGEWTVESGQRAKTNPGARSRCVICLPPKNRSRSRTTPNSTRNGSRHHLGVEVGAVYDTYLASILIAAGEGERRHGLADVVQFFLQRTLDKTEQVSDWGANELSHSQIEYAARDAAIMTEVREKLDERIALDGLNEVLELENECVMPIAEMELNGFYLDQERWREQLDKVDNGTGESCERAAGHARRGRRTGVAVWPAGDQSRFAGPGDGRAGRISASRCRTRRGRGSCSRSRSNIRRSRSCSNTAASRKGDVELWREHSRIYRAGDRPHPRRFSTDRRTDRTFLVLESEPAADTARGRVPPLLPRS